MPVLKAYFEAKSRKTSQPATDLSHTEKIGDFDAEEMTVPGHVNDRKHVNRAHVAASNGRAKLHP